MGSIFRRTKSTEVQVRRADEPRQEVVDIPGANKAAQAAGTTPNVTQNNFYISSPPQVPANANVPPQEIHHHTTVHHVSRVIMPSRGLSFFGVVGLVLGGLGCAAGFEPAAAIFVRPLALAGLVAGGLGLLGAILLTRSGKGAPVLALLVSGAAYGIWFHNNGGQLQAEMQKLRAKLPAELPKVDLGEIAKPPAASPPAPIIPMPVVVTPAPSRMDLESMREAAAQRMGLDYKSAKEEAEAAQAKLVRVQATEAPGSTVLAAVEQDKLDANSKLNAIKAKLRSDPTVAAAEQAIKSPGSTPRSP